MEVSIPKSRVTRLLPDDFQIECTPALSEFRAQRSKARRIDASWTDEKPLGTLPQFQLVAGSDAQSLQYSGRKSDLTFGGNLNEHDRSSNLLTAQAIAVRQ